MADEHDAGNPAGGTGTAQPPAGNGDPNNAGRAGAGSEDPAWLPKRLERAERQGRDSAFAELGIAPDEVASFKETLAKHREGESENVKLKRENEGLKRDLAAREKRIGELDAAHKRRTVEDDLRGAIGKEGTAGRMVINPEALVLSLTDPRQKSYLGVADDGSVAVFENGNPVRGKDTAAFLKEHLDSNLHLLQPVHREGGGGTGKTSGKGGGSGDYDPGKASFADRQAHARALAKERGILPRE